MLLPALSCPPRPVAMAGRAGGSGKLLQGKLNLMSFSTDRFIYAFRQLTAKTRKFKVPYLNLHACNNAETESPKIKTLTESQLMM